MSSFYEISSFTRLLEHFAELLPGGSLGPLVSTKNMLRFWFIMEPEFCLPTNKAKHKNCAKSFPHHGKLSLKLCVSGSVPQEYPQISFLKAQLPSHNLLVASCLYNTQWEAGSPILIHHSVPKFQACPSHLPCFLVVTLANSLTKLIFGLQEEAVHFIICTRSGSIPGAVSGQQMGIPTWSQPGSTHALLCEATIIY